MAVRQFKHRFTMFKNLSSLTLVTMTALVATPLWAQQSETTTTSTEQAQEEPAQSETGTSPATSGEAQLDLGQTVTGEPELGQRYSKETFDDFELACIKIEADKDPCSLLQILEDDNGNPVAEFSLFRISNGSQAVAGATVIVPLETLLPAQLTIAVDSNPGKRYNYSFCNPIGCVAQIGLTQADVDAFRRGSTAKISLRPAPAPDQVVELEMSLKGFTAGYDTVDVVSQ